MGRLRAGRNALAVGLVAAVLVAGACSADDDEGDTQGSSTTKAGERAAATVIVKNLDFKPVAVAVDAGEVVTWRFDDGKVPHDVKGDDFRSPAKTSGTWTHRFEKSGTFQYTCTIHPFMKGTVEVR